MPCRLATPLYNLVGVLKLSNFTVDLTQNTWRFNITTIPIKFIAPSIKPGKYHFLCHNYIPLNSILVSPTRLERVTTALKVLCSTS